MKRTNYLKGLRVMLAILFFMPVLLFFIDFANVLPDSVGSMLHLQIIPAILNGMVGVLVFQFALALLFGRIYCSVICPAGILQDVINRIFCLGRKKKKGVRRFTYHKPMNLLRYSLLGLTFLLAALGITELLVLLGPYSNFGRIANNLLRPVAMWANNRVADLLGLMDNYSVYQVTTSTVTTTGLISALAALTVFILMVTLRGRLYCNTLCPIGTLLSLFSRYSLFRISFDKEACTQCGNCEHTCKAEAINSREKTVDASRCVDCFNCISSCAKGGLQYRYMPFYRKEAPVTPVASAQATSAPSVQTESETNSRRTFLATSATVVATLPTLSALAKGGHHGGGRNGRKKWPPITPPGSLSLERFKDKCTACHLCVVQCPSQVLRPAGIEYGFDYLLRPHVSYMNSYCNYECTVCSDVCPTHAILPLTKEEKATTQVGIATFFINRCIVNTERTDCGACSEHCPTQAVHMVPFEGTLTIPHVEPELCIGCGGCESICPVRPMRAIIVKANNTHRTVTLPKTEEVEKVEVEDFGF
ncbi:MAG: 4Fe-4S binding protein [Tannerellaceae bacterium]